KHHGDSARAAKEIEFSHVAPRNRVPVFHVQEIAGVAQGKYDGLRRALRRGGVRRGDGFCADGEGERDDVVPVLEVNCQIRRAQPARRGDGGAAVQEDRVDRGRDRDRGGVGEFGVVRAAEAAGRKGGDGARL